MPLEEELFLPRDLISIFGDLKISYKNLVYWDAEGIITPSKRFGGKYRRYSIDDVCRLLVFLTLRKTHSLQMMKKHRLMDLLWSILDRSPIPRDKMVILFLKPGTFIISDQNIHWTLDEEIVPIYIYRFIRTLKESLGESENPAR